MTMQPKDIRRNATAIDLTRCFTAADRQHGISRRTQALLAAAGMEEPARRWFVISVESKMDRAVAEILAFADIEVWMPGVACKPTRRGGMGKAKRASVMKLATPGYLFVKVAGNDDSWAGLAQVKGVAGLLGSGGRPISVKDNVISLFRAYLGGNPDAMRIVTNAVSKGDKVLVTDGPFRTFPGVVEEMDADTMRAVVEILIFGRVTPVHLDLAQISKV